METKSIESAPGYAATADGRIVSPFGRLLNSRIDKDGYLRVTLWVNKRPLTRGVARLVAEAWLPDFDAALTVDHVNRNRTDNRACNLRMASVKDNSRNRSVQTNNCTGEPGVVWNCASNKWQAQIWVDGRTIYLGLHEQFSDAVRVRRAAAAEHFGQFAPSAA